MLKIRVATLPEAGLDINEKLSAETLNSRLGTAPDAEINKIEFADPVAVKLHVEKVPHGMTAEGEVTASCSQACSRCAEQVCHPITCPIKHVFKHHTDPEMPVPEDDIGVNYFRGEHIEMGSLLEELLVLSLSPYWHPEDNSNGTCSHCKLNLKERRKPVKLGTQGLGDALKKAGLS